MEQEVLQRMTTIFGECFLSQEREIEKDEIAFYENHADSFTKYLMDKAYRTLTQGENDEDMVEIILHSIHRASSLAAVMSFHNYSQFRSLTEQLEEGE